MRWPWARLTITRGGGISGVRIYTGALTPEEMQAEVEHALANPPITADKSSG
jgi:hypothetical protein